MTDYDALCEFLMGLVGQNIIVIDKKGRQKAGYLSEVFDNHITVEHTVGIQTHYPITGEYDFKPCTN